MPLTQAAQNHKQTNPGGLANLLKLKFGAKVMLTVNIRIQYRQINGQTGSISHIEFAQGSVSKIYVKFSESGLKAMRSSYFDRQSSWFAIEKCETEIPIKTGSMSPSIKRFDFLLHQHGHLLFKSFKV